MPLKKKKTRFANSRLSITKTLETSSREEQIKGVCNKYVNIPCSKVRCSFYMHHTWLNNNLKQFSCAFALRAWTVHVLQHVQVVKVVILMNVGSEPSAGSLVSYSSTVC